MPDDLTWRVDTKSNGSIDVDSLGGAVPGTQRNEQVTARCQFDPGASSHVSRYKSLREYLAYAGAGEVRSSVDGVAWYDDRIPSGAAVSSNALKFVPTGVDVPDFYRGFWGWVQQGSDQTTIPAGGAELELRMVYLADASQYADHSALESDLKV